MRTGWERNGFIRGRYFSRPAIDPQGNGLPAGRHLQPHLACFDSIHLKPHKGHRGQIAIK